jgi:hypothetical protein
MYGGKREVMRYILERETIPVTVRSKAYVCGRPIAGIAGSNPA